MKTGIYNRWADIPWRQATREVFRLQCRIHDAERRGDTATVNKLQQKLADSFFAKALAVRQVARISPGRKTAGIDGVKSPSKAEMMRMATGLSIHHRPSAVRRKRIPKPGKKELRLLGIPNLIDRAHQALLVIVLAPQWEAHFGTRQYGYRPGRSPIDAMEFLRRHMRKAAPEWVLELDIEAFFDRIDHDELLRRINAPTEITVAIRRCLEAGVVDFVDNASHWEPSTMGTPQGGPASPLLANIAMAGLQDHVEKAFRQDFRGRVSELGYPTVVQFADDAVILHRDREVIDWSRPVIEAYLAPLGLRLSPTKTRVSHTQIETRPNEAAGFDFLGFHFQHVWRRGKGGRRQPYALVTPSKRSLEKLYRDCVEIIDGVKLSRKQRGARRHAQAKGLADPVTIMILRLKQKIRGWGNYFRSCNAKTAFSRMDHLLHRKAWQWATRRFDRKTVGWIRENLFSGIELDKKGRPLLRLDGTPRKRGWTFTSPFVPKDKPHVVMSRLADIPIYTHTPVKPDKSFFDGDWCYWQARSRSRYPGTPDVISIGAFRRQLGKCDRCGELMQTGQRLEVTTKDRFRVIRHINCNEAKPSAPGSPHAIANAAQGIAKQARKRGQRARRVSVEHVP